MSTSAWSKVDWEQAACRGTDTESWYPASAGEAETQNVVLRKICGGCPILSECAAYAVPHEKHGFWGGLSPSARWDLRKKIGILEPQYENFISRDLYAATN